LGNWGNPHPSRREGTPLGTPETANKDTPIHVLSMVWALWLLVFLPLAGRFRSPGGVDPSWLPLFLANGALLIFNLSVLMRRKVRGRQRVVLFCSTGIAIFVGVTLAHFYGEQQAYDYWAHRGIHYFEDLD
jgi:hypothetical protein